MPAQELQSPPSAPVVREPAPTESRRLGYVDAAAFLGVKVSTLRVKVHRGEVPFHRLGGRLVVFDTGDLTAYLEDCKNLPAPSRKPRAA